MGIPYELTKDQFRHIIGQDCYWCGSNPKPWNIYYKKDGTRTKNGSYIEEGWAGRQWVFANGIDRLNSKLGYTAENCVPSCFDCNEMKNDKTPQEFLEHMDKILKFQKQKLKP